MKIYIVIETQQTNECVIKKVFLSFVQALKYMKSLDKTSGVDHDIIEREVEKDE